MVHISCYNQVSVKAFIQKDEIRIQMERDREILYFIKTFHDISWKSCSFNCLSWQKIRSQVYLCSSEDTKKIMCRQRINQRLAFKSFACNINSKSLMMVVLKIKVFHVGGHLCALLDQSGSCALHHSGTHYPPK